MISPHSSKHVLYAFLSSNAELMQSFHGLEHPNRKIKDDRDAKNKIFFICDICEGIKRF